MTIQEATELCLAEGSLFARPTAWAGKGKAIDIASILNGGTVRVVTPLGDSDNLRGEPWAISAQEVLSDWEVVSIQILRNEVCEKKA